MGTRARAAAPEPSRRLELAVVVCVLVVFVALIAPTLDHRLLDKHDFRQTQTAFPARIFHEEGIDLLHPRVPVLGEPYEIPFEFPLYQAAGSLVMDLGVADDTALRVTTLICFLATALLLYGLVRYVSGRAAAIGSLVAFVVTPFALVWSHAAMMEYMAAAGAVGLAWAFIVWREHRHPAVWALCLVAGLVGMLVKPTTAAFWLIPALAYRPRGPRQRRLWRDPWAAVLLVIPILAAFVWTQHADAIKRSSATTRWLTSGALGDWNFGSFEQRVDPAVWIDIGQWYAFLLIGPVGLALLIAAAVTVWRGAEQRRFWMGMACTAFVPPLVFTNLYKVHDYYVTAVAPAMAALIGLGGAFAVGMLRRRRTRIRLGAVVASLVLIAAWFGAGYRYWDVVVEGGGEWEATIFGLAEELDQVTDPGDLVAVRGLDWNPALFYYARRRGHMLVGANEPFAFDLIHDGPYSRLLVYQPDRPDEPELEFTSPWSWIGALGQHTYAIADGPDGVSGASFVATQHAREVDAHLAEARSIASARAVKCGRPVRIRAGANGTWVELTDPPQGARIAVPSLAPLPARQLVFVAPELADGGSVTIACSGVDRLAVAAFRDAGAID